MKPAPEALRSEALMRLERTRAAWLVRCANNQPAPDHAQAQTAAGSLAIGGTLNTVLSEWLANELSARLWPQDTASTDTSGSVAFGSDEQPPHPPGTSPNPLLDWTDRHPWLCVLAGLLAGGLAMSQRQRLLRWGISTALPWMTSQAAVVALPLLAQWLAHQPLRAAPSGIDAPAPDDAQPPQFEPGADPVSSLSEPSSPASGSPA